jgi:hypothetical protein
MPARGRVQIISARRRIQLVKTVASCGRSLVQPRGDALRFPVFAVSLAFLAASAALDAGVTPNYQIELDSLR